MYILKAFSNYASMPQQKGNKLFWGVAITCYALVVLATYFRMYVYHAYPIYYTEDEIPDAAGEIWTAISELGL